MLWGRQVWEDDIEQIEPPERFARLFPLLLILGAVGMDVCGCLLVSVHLCVCVFACE